MVKEHPIRWGGKEYKTFNEFEAAYIKTINDTPFWELGVNLKCINKLIPKINRPYFLALMAAQKRAIENERMRRIKQRRGNENECIQKTD